MNFWPILCRTALSIVALGSLFSVDHIHGAGPAEPLDPAEVGVNEKLGDFYKVTVRSGVGGAPRFDARTFDVTLPPGARRADPNAQPSHLRSV